MNCMNEAIFAAVSEVNAIQGMFPGWWYDTCATFHVCYDKNLFKTYIDGVVSWRSRKQTCITILLWNHNLWL